VDGRIILELVLQKEGGCEWFYLAQSRVHCRILRIMVMSVRIPQKWEFLDYLSHYCLF
jgi:hypothetical protein